MNLRWGRAASNSSPPLFGRARGGELRLQVGERRVGCAARRVGGHGQSRLRLELPLMLVVVAVQAQELPVAAVGRVVVVVVVAVVDRELAQVRAREFAAATSADPRV